MNVILKSDIKGLGKAFDVVKVRDPAETISVITAIVACQK